MNGTTQTVTWTISVSAVGGIISLDGYILNTLGASIPAARLDITGNGYQFTDINGYYNFANLTDTTQNILIRSIGYENLSIIHTNIVSAESMNFTLNEKESLNQNDIYNAGIIGGLMSGFVLITLIKRRIRGRQMSIIRKKVIK